MLKMTYNVSGMENERDHVIETLAGVLADHKHRLVDAGKELLIEIDGKLVVSIDIAQLHPGNSH